VPLPAVATTEDVPRRYDPPHVLWYFGALTAALAANATIVSVSSAHRGIWQLLVGLVLVALFAGAAFVLLGAGWRVPGGVLVVAAVVLVPAVGLAFERLIGVWPDIELDPFALTDEFEGAHFALAVATILAGLAAFALVGFPFVFAPVTIAGLVAAQLLLPLFVDGPSADQRASTAIVSGAVLVLVGLVLDSVARAADAFWWHAVGLLGVAVGLAWYGIVRSDTWAWVTMLVLGGVLVLASAPFGRATWTTFGVLGVFGAALRYDVDWFGSWRSPALMIAVSLGLILVGIALQLYAQAWAARFGHAAPAPAPAPAVEPEPEPEEPPAEEEAPVEPDVPDEEPPPGERA
jgi:hypothetical protein